MQKNSIRRTLLIRCGLGLCLLFTLLSITIYFMVRRSLYQELDQSIVETASILANQMEYEHGEIIFEWQEGLGTNSEISDQSLFQYWNETSGLTTRSPALGVTDLQKFSGKNGTPLLQTISVPGRLEHARAIGLTIHPYILPEEGIIMMGEGKTFDPRDFPHTLVVARDLTPILRTLAYLSATLAIGTLTSFLLGFLIIGAAVRSSLSPIKTLSQQFLNRSENQLEDSIILPDSLPSELVPLTESFNTFLTRIASIRTREKDFIRHAAHELRTPIAGLLATTDLALSRQRTAAEYEKHLLTCQLVATDLGELVKRLSALSRISQADIATQLHPVKIRPILEKTIQDFRQRIDRRQLDLDYIPSAQNPEISSDPTLLQLIFSNLIDNAASYSAAHSTISISTIVTEKAIEIAFTNPAEDLPENLERLFEPLFRQEKSRYQTESGNSHLGIGLTLSLSAATALNSTLKATRPSHQHICLKLSLPIH
ncbi:sensor histidine kinase [Luteolibacter sp. AS25]|uniref:sensor histidine kinase n=1 Tax=Luteolibacter sp. AS25 TaxID=3135776 RepID=UPI00398A915B